MRRSDIERENRSLLERQRQFRAAADGVTAAWMKSPDVRAIAVIGSVARPLWKEVPRFREFSTRGIELWHECGDLDLAVWLDTLDHLDALRRTRDLALRKMVERGAIPFNKQIEGFRPRDDLLAGAMLLYERGSGRLRNAVDFPDAT